MHQTRRYRQFVRHLEVRSVSVGIPINVTVLESYIYERYKNPTAFAEALGVSHVTVLNWLHKRRINPGHPASDFLALTPPTSDTILPYAEKRVILPIILPILQILAILLQI